MSSDSFKILSTKCVKKPYILNICIKMDLELNNIVWLIWHKTKPNQTKLNQQNLRFFFVKMKFEISTQLVEIYNRLTFQQTFERHCIS